MKKISKTKLAINKNTIRFLSGGKLEEAVGGRCKDSTCAPRFSNIAVTDTCGCFA